MTAPLKLALIGVVGALVGAAVSYGVVEAGNDTEATATVEQTAVATYRCPGDETLGARAPGDQVWAIGVDATGDWVALRDPVFDEVWVPLSTVDTGDLSTAGLPVLECARGDTRIVDLAETPTATTTTTSPITLPSTTLAPTTTTTLPSTTLPPTTTTTEPPTLSMAALVVDPTTIVADDCSPNTTTVTGALTGNTPVTAASARWRFTDSGFDTSWVDIPMVTGADAVTATIGPIAGPWPDFLSGPFPTTTLLVEVTIESLVGSQTRAEAFDLAWCP